jgi:hypothetical protein
MARPTFRSGRWHKARVSAKNLARQLHRRVGATLSPAASARSDLACRRAFHLRPGLPPPLPALRWTVAPRRWQSAASAGTSSSSSSYGVGVDPKEKPWSELNERQRKVVAELGWDSAEAWDANEEHEHWFRELPAKLRSKAKSIGLDEQLWDTKKFLASPEGRKNDAGMWLILAAAAVLAAAGAAVYELMRTADETRRRAAVWQKTDWSELAEEEQAAVSALGLGIDSETGWQKRFDLCASVSWDVIAEVEARAAAALSMGMAAESWPPVAEPEEGEVQDVLAELASAADAAETFSLTLAAAQKLAPGRPSVSLGIVLDREEGIVTAAPHAYESLDLIGRRLLAVEGQNVSNDAGVTAEERAAVMMRALMGRSAGESIDLTFSCYDDAPAAAAADVAS